MHIGLYYFRQIGQSHDNDNMQNVPTFPEWAILCHYSAEKSTY